MMSPFSAGRPDSDDRSERRFDAIGPRQCLELIASQHVGRVAWQAADLPQILPVTYTMHDGSAYFRTSPHGILAELARPTSVAFEVEELDQQTRSGWCIVLHGLASAVSEPDGVADLWATDSLVPWASENRTLFIRIRPERVSGRVLRRYT
jgi:nitroimidazol reductase NimA-like FMN-containing flavoprotein (pyridoxamine 5'-phosphate oxidase superfamily)